ncbi:hypothetical protein SAMN04489724_3839 [Algoriphagus locisalis]|uniref:TolB-like 6-blade propeller-like n=1 Tax=Algoriphagus locisalis TaxID=305507 RepID=A0A1I7DAU8_9BACT|nr:DUF4221 family protein [Algoriphagus locisalis]SFU08750.1 hypothetical protein SAMN04489724_3839 [Algoriphagus locisalis]
MRKLTFLSYIIINSLGISCSPKSEKEVEILDLKELIVDTLYLEKDTLTKNLSDNFSYYKTDSGEVLVTFLNHNLLVFSYPEGKQLKKQNYEIEGPDGIGSFLTGSYIDKNSLYILSQQKELIQCDFEGNVISRWDFPKVSEERMYANYSSAGFNRVRKSGAELSFVDIPYVFVEGLEGYDKWGMVFNTESDAFSHFNFSYPKAITEYLNDDQLGLFSHVYLPTSGEHLIGFAISDSIAVVKNGKQTWKWAGTTESLEFKRGTTVPSGEYIVFQPDHSSSKYNGLDHDTHAKKILRWVRVKGPTQENMEQERNRLLVFDEVLNREAELEFDREEMGQYGFNTPRGYALSLYSETTDDETAYIILDFSKINSLE